MNLMDDIMKDVAEDITPNSTLMAIKLYIQMLNDKELLVQSDDLQVISASQSGKLKSRLKFRTKRILFLTQNNLQIMLSSKAL